MKSEWQSNMHYGGQNEFGPIKKILLKRPKQAFISSENIERQWRELNYSSSPDYDSACKEHEEFTRILSQSIPEILFLPEDDITSLDSIYTRDALLCTNRGVILANMGKARRDPEPAQSAKFLAAHDIPVLGRIEGSGRVEGGDVLFLDDRTLVVGRGYRTNDEGIAQLKKLMVDLVDEIIVVPLPHWEGDGGVFHLMSFISPIDIDMAIVYSRLMPVPFRELLIARGIKLLEVTDEEFPSMGCNILAVSPREVLMLDGNESIRELLISEGVRVTTYRGNEISRKGEGGPTCLTRPLLRE